MTMISDLPRDLIENLLFRVPLTSIGRVRFACKRWKGLSEDPSFAKHFGKGARLVIMKSEFRVWLMSVNFHNGVADPFVKEAKLTSLNNLDQVEISEVFHCNGLLLCLTKDKTQLVVWNPYLGQTRWIEPSNSYHKFDIYALGYDINNNQKVLRILDVQLEVVCEVYELKSNSWRVLDVTDPDWEIPFHRRGVTLKGNTYFLATERIVVYGVAIEEQDGFFLCFDFTSERFGPRLPLPFQSYTNETVSLSSVREEQIAAFFQNEDTGKVEIWVTNKIEPNAVAWSKLFLAVDMELASAPHHFYPYAGSFFIDEEQKIAVVFDQDKEGNNTAYLIGENGCYKELDLGEDGYHKEEVEKWTSFPLVCSYLPTSLKIQQSARGKRKERDY